MWLLIICIVLTNVIAEWPPRSCPYNVKPIGTGIFLTNPKKRIFDTSCSLTEPYHETVYVEVSRKYGPTNTKSKHSIFSVTVENLKYSDKQLQESFVINMKNDLVEIISKKTQSKNSCFGIFASSGGNNVWMRLRVHPLPELQKTFVSVATWTDDSMFFIQCAQVEVDTLFETFEIKLSAFTDTKMTQIVHNVTSLRPVLWKSTPFSYRDISHKFVHVEEQIKYLVKKLTENENIVHTLKMELQNNNQKAKTVFADIHGKVNQNHIHFLSTLSGLKTKLFVAGSGVCLMIILATLFSVKCRSGQKRFEHIL